MIDGGVKGPVSHMGGCRESACGSIENSVIFGLVVGKRKLDSSKLRRPAE